MKKAQYLIYFMSLLVAGSMMMYLSGCTHDDAAEQPTSLPPLEKQVRVQVAYDATNVAFHFTWKSQKKLYPTGKANTGKNYPGHFHDLLVHNGTIFNRFPEADRLQEDRVTFMIDKFDAGIPNFALAGCAMACHAGATPGTFTSHNINAAGQILDHWHWRGHRSGPMGYAEDVNVTTSRQMDNVGTPPSKFMRASGDRLREDQAALTGTSANNVVVKGFPRFVFNKGKAVGGFTIPKYFIVDESGVVLTDALTGIPFIKDVSKNRSLLVVFQDKTFDPVDKVNSLDLAYLVYKADGSIDQLPPHLREGNAAYDATAFNTWKNFWDAETSNISQANALTKLTEIHDEWVASGNKAMIARSVGYIYNSDQHNVTSDRAYDAVKNEWTVTLYRKLASSSPNDADLSGLPGGTKYAFSFAMHDSGAGSQTHDISMPYVVSKDASADIQAASVTDVNTVDWSKIAALDTHWVKQALMPKYTWDYLKLGAHGGATSVGTAPCATCHTATQLPLLNATPLN